MASKKKGGRPLIIVESPAKARTIEKAFGRGYKVTASLGHLRDLPRSQLGVDIEQDFEPKYITVRGRGPVVKELRTAAQKVGKILLAADPDREGEAISWHLAHLLGLDPTGPCRIVFREITKEAVTEAIRHPRPIDMNLVDAQQARRVLDRLVGYGLSPLLWRKVRRGLSAGRVQSVAVRLICDREAEIEAFVPEEYWSITAVLSAEDGAAGAGGPTIEARFVGKVVRGGKIEKVEITSAGEAERVTGESREARWTVLEVKRGTRRRNPPPPFTTSSMQQEAANRLNFTVRRTMALAQQLYEGVDVGEKGPVGLITYMRTDATRVSESAREQARVFVGRELGSDYLPAEPPKHKAGRRAQEAHEAIRPTDPSRTPSVLKPHLDRDQYRLYRLIWERFMASEMAPAVYATVSAEFDAGGWGYRATGSEVTFPGYLAITGLAGVDTPGPGRRSGRETAEAPPDEREEAPLTLPEMSPGREVALVEITPEQHFTSPPPRYNEASLVKAMEELGIGRPSTYAPTIETITGRGYVSRADGRLAPTKLGQVVNELLLEQFPEVIDVAFTAAMEEQLDEVEEGQLPWRKVVRRFYEPFSVSLKSAEEELGPVEVPDEETGIVCEACGLPMVVKYGRYGRFLACSGYPECRQTKPYATPTGAVCPKCGGEVVEKRTRKGRRFYGCIRYPECDFSIWSRPTGRQCPECGSFMVAAGRGNGPAGDDAPAGDGEAAGPPDGQAPGDRPAGRRLRCVNDNCAYEGYDQPTV